LANVGGEDAAVADPMAEDDGEGATAGADIRDGHAGLQLENLHKLRNIDLGLLALLCDLLRVGLLRVRRDGGGEGNGEGDDFHGDSTPPDTMRLDYLPG